MRLEDKIAIVTGAAHGMGEAEARLFAREAPRSLLPTCWASRPKP
jgi:NAD(P)-dependent dehydrogenase (short-subunit alcohol dehydrogenase family)